ncbi:MAG: hypothetical protein MUC35_05625 [Candidatus Margulisbacteria bacterium]|nr:hypothetical protein [Candidatus Margulisiibacteriota bacterium]
MSGLGRGSVFGPKRFLAVHNPFDGDMGKAGDPYLNWHSLAKLSHRKSPEVRKSVTDNLAGRLNARFQPFLIELFDAKVVHSALIQAAKRFIAPAGHGLIPEAIEADFYRCFTKSAGDLTAADLKELYAEDVRDKIISSHLLLFLGQHPNTPRKVLCEILSPNIDNSLAHKYEYAVKLAYQRVEASLSTAELDEISVNLNQINDFVKLLIAKHPRASRNLLLRLVNDAPHSTVRQNVFRDWGMHRQVAYDRIWHTLKEDELSALLAFSEDRPLKPFQDRIIKHPRTPKTAIRHILFEAAAVDSWHVLDELKRTAFDILKDDLSGFELLAVAQLSLDHRCRHLAEVVIQYSKTPADTIAQLIERHFPKSEKTGIGYTEKEWEDIPYDTCCSNLNDAAWAVALLQHQGLEKQRAIVAQLPAFQRGLIESYLANETANA